MKLTSWKTPSWGEALDDEHIVADRGLLLREQGGHVAAHHLAHDGVSGGLADRARGDVGAVAHDGDGVAEREHLVEAVGDEQDGPALVAEAPRDREQPLDLDAGQRRGRLVHDENPRIQGDGLRDLDDLLVGDGQSERRAVRVHPDAEALEQGERLFAHRAPVDHAQCSGAVGGP